MISRSNFLFSFLFLQYKVYGLPTLLLFSGGQEVEGSHKEGAVTKAVLQKWLGENGIQK